MDARLELLGTCFMVMFIITALVFTVAGRLSIPIRMVLAVGSMTAFSTPYIRDAFRGFGGTATGILYMSFAGLLALSIFTFIALRQEE